MKKQLSLEIENGNLVPPVGNTEAQSTGQRILIDWFAFTLPFGADIWETLTIPEKEWVSIETRALGYKRVFIHGAMKVYTSDREDMGVHCELSGSACREYEFFFGNRWAELIKKIREAHGTFSRIDLAIDDFDGIFTLEEIKGKIDRGEVISFFRRGRKLEEFNLGEKDNLGQTIYFGSPQSRTRVRMYDKAIEQLIKEQQSRETEAIERESKEKVPPSLRRENKKNREGEYRRERLEHHALWNRTEIQCRDERAGVLADYLQAGLPVGEITFGILRHYLNFVDPSLTDSNKSRWPVSAFWEKFLGCVEELGLTIAKQKRTIKQVREWIIRQVAPSLALLSLDKTLKVNLEDVVKIILLARHRLRKKHYALLESA